MRCCVADCPNSKRRVKNVSLFSLPKAHNRLQWLEILNMNPASISPNTRVCERHFTEDDLFQFATKRKLKPGTVPTLHLPNEVLEEGTGQNPITPKQTVGKKCRKHFNAATFQQHPKPLFAVERFCHNNSKIFYYSGVQSYEILKIIFRFVYKAQKETVGIVQQEGRTHRKQRRLTPLNELFLTLMKLRRNFDFQTLADMFMISKSTVGRIFGHWINLLYLQLADMNIFPSRDILLSKATPLFLKKYPKVIGSIDCTEFLIQTPSSLVRQSQCYSQYRGSSTLKSLLMINPNGAIIFVSSLYTGSISDKQIVEESGFLNLLKRKVERGQLNRGDVLLADKGFEIKDILETVGIDLNIPTFKVSGQQYREEEVEYIRKIAQERVHVERAIRRLKTFKILSHKIPISLLGNFNQIYTVCALLTNFMSPLKKF